MNIAVDHDELRDAIAAVELRKKDCIEKFPEVHRPIHEMRALLLALCRQQPSEHDCDLQIILDKAENLHGAIEEICTQLSRSSILWNEFTGLIRKRLTEELFEQDVNAALESDIEMHFLIKAGAFDNRSTQECAYPRGLEDAPIVRASVYRNEEIDPLQEILFNGFNRYSGQKPYFLDLRRPVLMRSAFKYLLLKHGGRNEWCENIVRRYFRRIKYTCVEPEEHEGVMNSIREALTDKLDRFGLGVRRKFLRKDFHVGTKYPNHINPSLPYMAWIDGEYLEFVDKPKLNKCPVCSRLFKKKVASQKTCGKSCSEIRSTINATRMRAAYQAIKDLGLIKEGDLL